MWPTRTIEAQISVLERMIEMLRVSHKRADGLVVDPEVVREIECLVTTKAMLERN